MLHQFQRKVLIVLIALCVSAASVELSQRIKHVIVLMEENRSYDHLMGWNRRSKNGLKTTYCNSVNVSNSSAKKVCANGNAPYVNFCDPDHSFPATSYKIFGPGANEGNGLWNATNPTMEGFVEYERDERHHMNPKLQFCGVMDAFTPDRTPVLTALTEDFGFFDKFYCSLPGPTWPNRLFMLSGTSAGLTETIPWYHGNPGDLFPVKTIFDQVEEAGGSWKYYYDDTPWELFIEQLAHSPENTHDMNQFHKDCKEGTLPNFAFMNPRAGVNLTSGLGSNDMHPDHDVALGEALYKEIYEALRASPQWNETLFVLTFDEHGGLFDHVHPPKDIPNPGDNEKSYPDKFDFDRAGIRIPTVLASPWLPKGFVTSDPPAAQMPQKNSHYELTSIMATTRKLLGFMNGTGSLTKRDAWAATFEHLFDVLDEPRTDCPMTLPDAPKPSLYMQAKEQFQPVNGLQNTIMETHAQLVGVPFPDHITMQGEVGEWIQAHHHLHREKTMRWKKSKHVVKHSDGEFTDQQDLMLKLQTGAHYVSRVFRVSKNASVTGKTATLSTEVEIEGKNVTLCWDGGNMTRTSLVGLSECYPSRDPAINRDPSQQWLVLDDHTIRPVKNPNMCITSRVMGGSNNLRLYDCADANHPGTADDASGQRFAWMWGPPSDNGGDVVFQWGDAYYEIQLTNKSSGHNPHPKLTPQPAGP